MLQNYGSASAPLYFFVFDLLVLNGKDVMAEPLMKRRELLEKHVITKLSEPVQYSPELKANLKDLIQSVKAQGLEGLVAKRRDSKYEPGLRSGAWQKMRVNQGQEFVIAGYTPSPKNELRRGGNWLLRWREADLCVAHPKWVHPGFSNGIVQKDEATGNRGLSLRQSTGEKGRSLGSGADRENGRMPMAETGAGGSV
jgi:ATP dependent DNA ligase-like protein